MVEARKFDFNKDYDILQTWWNEHGLYPPKPEHLSNTGIIIEVEEKPACAGFLYHTDSKICVFEFVVSNPKIEKFQRERALKKLIEAVKNIAKKWDYHLIYTSINKEAYIKKLKDADFIEVDKNQTHMFFEVK